MTSPLDNPAVEALASRCDQPLRDMRALRTLIQRYGEGVTLGEARDLAAQVVAEATTEYQRLKREGKAL